jgi:ferritin-like metal-binding protein YciE
MGTIGVVADGPGGNHRVLAIGYRWPATWPARCNVNAHGGGEPSMRTRRPRMAAKSLRDLFIEELRDAYDGEKRLLKALPKMAKASTNEELQNAFISHAKETDRQVARLEKVFRSIGESARGKKCNGIVGIVEEAKTAIDEMEKGAVLDAALIAGGQRAEHYEIAAYGTLAHFADLLGEQRAKDLLGQTLDEEKAADEKLNTIAMSDVNREALTTDRDESDEGSGIARSLEGGIRRVAKAMGLVNQRGGRNGGRSVARGANRTTKGSGGGSSRARGSARATKKR